MRKVISVPDKGVLANLAVQVPQGGDIDRLLAAPDLPPFHPSIVDFVGALSRALMKTQAARGFPEIISLAHWMRPRALLDLAENYAATRPVDTVPLSRGVALHFAPGNVDTIFLYSALLAILTGNRNVVRVSSRPSPQIDLLVEVLNTVLADPAHHAVADRLLIVKYDHDDAITAALSGLCDLRVIWGGDQTVQTIRALPLPPRARDVSFPNRWSLAALSAEAVLACDTADLAKLGTDFANDAYWFGQMACSSPRMALWVGPAADCLAAAARFWPAVRDAAERFAPEIAPVNFVNKLVSQHIAAIKGDLSHIAPLRDNVVIVRCAEFLHLPDADDIVAQRRNVGQVTLN
ncbi:MAG: acyl-CoA reductase, partial [Pseudomonadota bacterium]